MHQLCYHVCATCVCKPGRYISDRRRPSRNLTQFAEIARPAPVLQAAGVWDAVRSESYVGTAPNVSSVCFYSTGVEDTAGSFTYRTTDFSDEPTVHEVDGDGTVTKQASQGKRLSHCDFCSSSRQGMCVMSHHVLARTLRLPAAVMSCCAFMVSSCRRSVLLRPLLRLLLLLLLMLLLLLLLLLCSAPLPMIREAHEASVMLRCCCIRSSCRRSVLL